MVGGGLACTSPNPNYQGADETSSAATGASSRGPGTADGSGDVPDTTATGVDGTAGDPTTDTSNLPGGCSALPPPEGTICHGVVVLGLPQGCDARPVLVAAVDGDAGNDVLVGCHDGRVFVLPGGLGPPQQVGSVESQPRDLAVADFDDAGGNDIVVVTDGSRNAVHLFTRSGPGFSHDMLNPGPSPSSVATGRWFGGALPDIAVTIPSINQVVVLRNSGSGAFSSSEGFTVPFDPQDVAMGPVDQGETVDLVVASEEGNMLTLLLNNGSGAVLDEVPFFESPGARPNQVLLNDIELDETVDILATLGGDSPALSGIRVQRNIGAGGFMPEYGQYGEQLRGLDDGNFDGNLYPDAVMADYEGESIIFLMLLNDRDTVESFTMSLGQRPWSIAAGPIDGDMLTDVVVSLEDSGELALILSSP